MIHPAPGNPALVGGHDPFHAFVGEEGQGGPRSRILQEHLSAAQLFVHHVEAGHNVCSQVLHGLAHDLRLRVQELEVDVCRPTLEPHAAVHKLLLRHLAIMSLGHHGEEDCRVLHVQLHQRQMRLKLARADARLELIKTDEPLPVTVHLQEETAQLRSLRDLSAAILQGGRHTITLSQPHSALHKHGRQDVHQSHVHEGDEEEEQHAGRGPKLPDD
mmetsp:Transcript_52433/g.152428  ORF Transcript_52433/g.152428 Transcript_52433/m.152428 type:complete len:216 (+) Transcript_52433:206-853(+)